MKEQRRHARVPSRQRCWCEGEDVTLYTQLRDLSEGGLFLITSAPLARGARVRVQLGSGRGELRASAEVVWRRPRPGAAGNPGMGLRFDRLDEAARSALRSQLGA